RRCLSLVEALRCRLQREARDPVQPGTRLGGRACQPRGCRRRLSAGEIFGTDERHCGKPNCEKPECCAGVRRFRDVIEAFADKSVSGLDWSKHDIRDLEHWIAHNSAEDNSADSRPFERVEGDTGAPRYDTLDPIRVTIRAYARVLGDKEGQIQSLVNRTLVCVQRDRKHGPAKDDIVDTIEITK